MERIFDLNKGMTQAISHYSRFQDAGKELDSGGKYVYTGQKQVTAEDKIKDFYKNTIRFLLGAALVLFIVTDIAGWMGSSAASAIRDREAAAVTPNTIAIAGPCEHSL